MTHKPPISYKGRTTFKGDPGKVVVNFIENNQQILIKLNHFHYEVMVKLMRDTPRKALEYARSSGVPIDSTTQKNYIINIEENIKMEDKQGE